MIDKTIYYHDTDAGGVVYYGRYLNFLEEARTEYLSSQGVSVAQLAEEGLLFAVHQANITYKAPARYGDVIHCTADPIEIKPTRITFHQTITDKSTNKTLVEADITLACIDQKSFKPAAIPESVHSKIK